MQPSSYKKNGKRLCEPEDWYVSEKLDGMKGRWIDGKMTTRQSRVLHIPEWFAKLLPDENIEGELYFGRGSFHRTASLRTSSKNDEAISDRWKKVCFCVFDLIDYRLTWIERQEKLRQIINTSENICLLKWKQVQSSDDVERIFNKVVKKGGEGVVLANPWGLYEDGHVEQILKYKAVQDKEARIIGYQTDSEEKRLTSLIVTDTKTNVKFNIGTGLKMSQRFNYQKKFPLNSLVTYTYEQLGKNGKPRTPIFKGLRVDLE